MSTKGSPVESQYPFDKVVAYGRTTRPCALASRLLFLPSEGTRVTSEIRSYYQFPVHLGGTWGSSLLNYGTKSHTHQRGAQAMLTVTRSKRLPNGTPFFWDRPAHHAVLFFLDTSILRARGGQSLSPLQKLVASKAGFPELRNRRSWWTCL